MYALTLSAFVATAVAFSPVRTNRFARATTTMTATVIPTETVLALAARDARGLAIDSISSVIQT